MLGNIFFNFFDFKTMKTLFTTLMLTIFGATITLAQENAPMEIYTFQQYKSEHSKPEKNKTTIMVSGTQGDKVINVKVVTTPNGMVELVINDNEITTEEMANFQKLTDCITDYAEMPRSKAAPKIPEPEEPKQVEFSDVNDYIIAELKKDKLITAETKVFDVVIAYDKMFFNGKAQTAEMSKKYKVLYEEKSGKKIERTTYYHFSQTL